MARSRRESTKQEIKTVCPAAIKNSADVGVSSAEQGDRMPVRSFHQHHSDEEDEDEEGFRRSRRRGPSVDEFLRGSELGRPVRT